MQLVRGMFWPTQIGYLLGKKGLHYSNAPFYTLPHDLCWPKHIHYKRVKHVGLWEACSTSFVLIIIINNALLKCLNVNIDLLAKKLEDPSFSKNVVIKLSSFKSPSLSIQTNFLQWADKQIFLPIVLWLWGKYCKQQCNFVCLILLSFRASMNFKNLKLTYCKIITDFI